MQDISKEADFYLTKKAREALKKKALTTVDKYDTGEVFLCTYFGVVVNISDVEDGIKLVAGRINELAQRGQIHSCLAHFRRLDLSPETTGYFDEEGNPKEMRTAILCYVLVPELVHKELQEEALELRQQSVGARNGKG